MLDYFFSRRGMLETFFSKIYSDTGLIRSFFPNDSLSRLKGVFVAHSHYDHAMDIGYIHQLSKANIYGSSSTLNIARGSNVAEEHLFDFAKDSIYTIGKFKIQVVRSIHSIPKWYNNDVGEIIEKRLDQPAKYRDYKEGGAFDFLITHGSKKIIIRPSINYIHDQWKDVHADIIFLGISQMGKYTQEFLDSFYYENITQVKPSLVVPFHHDDFFIPITKEEKYLAGVPEGLDYLMERTYKDSIELKLIKYFHQIRLKTN